MRASWPLPVATLEALWSWLFRSRPFRPTIKNAPPKPIGPHTPFVQKTACAPWDDSGSFAGSFRPWRLWIETVVERAQDVHEFSDLYPDPREASFFASVLALFAIHTLEHTSNSRASVHDRLLGAYPRRYRESMTGIASLVDWHVKYKASFVDRWGVRRLQMAWKQKHGTVLSLRTARYVTLWIVYQLLAFVRTQQDVFRRYGGVNVFSMIETIRSFPQHPGYFLVHVSDRRARRTVRDKCGVHLVVNASHGHVPSSSESRVRLTIPRSLRAFVVCGLNSIELPPEYVYRLTRERRRTNDPDHNYRTNMFGQQHFSESTLDFDLRTQTVSGPGQPHAVALDARFLALVDRIRARPPSQTGFVYRRTRFQVVDPGARVPNVRFHARDRTQGVRAYHWNPRYPSCTAYDESRRVRWNRSLWEGKRYTLRDVFRFASIVHSSDRRPTYVLSHSCLHARRPAVRNVPIRRRRRASTRESANASDETRDRKRTRRESPPTRKTARRNVS